MLEYHLAQLKRNNEPSRWLFFLSKTGIISILIQGIRNFGIDFSLSINPIQTRKHIFKIPARTVRFIWLRHYSITLITICNRVRPIDIWFHVSKLRCTKTLISARKKATIRQSIFGKLPQLPLMNSASIIDKIVGYYYSLLKNFLVSIRNDK